MTSCHRLARAHREHTAAPHPVLQDGANPTRTGCSIALDREIPLLAFVGRIPRTGAAGCCGRALRGAFIPTSCRKLKRLGGGSPTALVSDCVGRFNDFVFIHLFPTPGGLFWI